MTSQRQTKHDLHYSSREWSRHHVLTSQHSAPQVRCILHRDLTVAATFLVFQSIIINVSHSYEMPPPHYSDINTQLYAQNISHKVCRTIGCYCLSYFDEKFYINIRLLINRWIATSTLYFKTMYSIHSHEPHSRLLPPLVNTTPSCLALDFVHRDHHNSRPFIISREFTWRERSTSKNIRTEKKSCSK